ncbi:MAG: hypothetical protein MJK15_04005 [Colwellia sp.]|nr:hypothetical protein [Colwellia sp.]
MITPYIELITFKNKTAAKHKDTTPKSFETLGNESLAINHIAGGEHKINNSISFALLYLLAT